MSNREIDVEDWGVQVGTQQNSGNPPALMQFEPEEDVEETATDRVAAMLGYASADEKAYVKVSRVTGPNKFAWCEDYSVADYESGGLKMIRDTWGPGVYEIRLYGTRPESKRFTVLAKSQIEIVLPVGATAAPAHANHGFETILRAMQEQNTKIMEVLTNRPQVDPHEAFMKNMQMISVMKEAIGGGGGGNSISEIMKAIREMREVSEELNPPKAEADKEPDLMSMLPGIMDLVKTGMQQKQAAPEPVPQVEYVPEHLAMQPNPIPQPAQVPQPAEKNLLDEDPMNLYQIIKLKTLLSTILKMAEKNAPVEPAADLLLAELPEELLDIMEQDDWFAALKQGLAAMQIDVTAHQAWLTRVREAMMTEEPGSDPTVPTTPTV